MKIVIVAEPGFTRTSANVNLRVNGFAITEAEPTCLLDVLVVLREVLPNLAVIDYEIPLCNCETMVRIVREDPILCGMPLLLLVERWASEGVERMKRWPQVFFMEKPLQVEALVQAVQERLPAFRTLSLDPDSPR